LLALRTQQIVAHETGVTNTIDPVAGSYAVESLTAQLEDAATRYLKKIDSLGGMLQAIESGFVQKEIQKSAFAYQRAVETGEQIVVGVNEFQAERERQIPTLRIDPAMEREQVARLEALRKPVAGDSKSGRKLRHARRSLRHPAPRLRRIPGIGRLVNRQAGLTSCCSILEASP